MPLILRVPTDFRKPPPGRPCTDYDVVSVTARWYVGRIFTEQMAQGERWRWSITSVFMEGMPSSGYTDSLDDAKREFAAAWRAWLAKTGRDEETQRPFYGRPVVIDASGSLIVQPPQQARRHPLQRLGASPTHCVDFGFRSLGQLELGQGRRGPGIRPRRKERPPDAPSGPGPGAFHFKAGQIPTISRRCRIRKL